MESSFIIAVSLGVAFVMVFFVLVAIIVYQRWRISDNNAHLEKFINENIEMRRKLRKAGIYAVAALNIMLLSCSKAEDMEGMNDMRAFYSYKAFSKDFDYQVAEGPFDTAIRFSVGMDPIQGGNDDKVIEACDKCFLQCDRYRWPLLSVLSNQAGRFDEGRLRSRKKAIR